MSPLPPARAQSSPDVCGGTDGPETPAAAHKCHTLAVVQRKQENSLLLNFCPPCHSLRALWRAAVLTYGHVAHFAIISLLAQLALSRCPWGKSFPFAFTWDKYLQGDEDFHFSRWRELLPSLQVVALGLCSTHVCTSVTGSPARGNLQRPPEKSSPAPQAWLLLCLPAKRSPAAIHDQMTAANLLMLHCLSSRHNTSACLEGPGERTAELLSSVISHLPPLIYICSSFAGLFS